VANHVRKFRDPIERLITRIPSKRQMKLSRLWGYLWVDASDLLSGTNETPQKVSRTRPLNENGGTHGQRSDGAGNPPGIEETWPSNAVSVVSSHYENMARRLGTPKYQSIPGIFINGFRGLKCSLLVTGCVSVARVRFLMLWIPDMTDD
jgi:hypothetical protein